MARITTKDLDGVQERLNLTVKNFGIEFIWNSRNGYHCIDYRMEREDGEKSFDTFRTGLSKSEAYELMNAMSWISQIANEKFKKEGIFGFFI